MIKTPILSGVEVCVEGLGGQNAAVKNLSDSPIWASIYPNITAGADNVVEIPAGAGEVVLDANGTIYLLGTGKVQCTGTSYSTPNFKMPSSSASGGGGEITPTAETMPVMNGIKVRIDRNNYVNTNGNENDIFPINAYATDTLQVSDPVNIYTEFPLTGYILFRIKETGQCAVLERSCNQRGYGNYCGVNIDANSTGAIGFNINSYDTVHTTDYLATDYHVCAFSVKKGTETANSDTITFYIDGEKQIEYSGNATANKAAYQGYVAVNCSGRGWENYTRKLDIKYLALGVNTHTEEQIKRNSEWIMSKYMNVAPKPEEYGETMPHLDGLQGYYDWQDADVENAVWKNKIDGACTLELAGDCSVQDDCFRFGASGLGKCNMANPAHVIYAIMKVSDPYIFNTKYPQFISEIANFSYNNRMCLCLVPRNGDTITGADNGMRLTAGSWGRPNYCTNTYAVDYFVYCLARDEDFNFQLYTNLDFDYSFVIGNATKVYANGYQGITLLNSESKNGTTFNPENASIASDWKFFAIGDGVQTPEQIRENIAWLAKKYGIGG